MAHGRAVSILIAATVAGLPLALVACAPSPPETPNPAAALAAQLTADERTALRLACDAAGSRAATEECHARQARDLALTPRPIQLARLDADDRLHLNAACSRAQALGPAEFRRCQERELVGLASAPVMPVEPTNQDSNLDADESQVAEPSDFAAAATVEIPKRGEVPPARDRVFEVDTADEGSTRRAIAGERLDGRAHALDGDTLSVGGVHVRLKGVAAPELAHPSLGIVAEAGGAEAAAFMRGLVEDHTVVCDLTRERTHERRVGTCYRGGRDVGAAIIEAGLARECPSFSRGLYAGLEPPVAKRLPLPTYCIPPGTRVQTLRPVGATKRAAPITPAAGTFACGTKRTCNQMVSCAEAQFYLEQCNMWRLDRDSDGIPCESLC